MTNKQVIAKCLQLKSHREEMAELQQKLSDAVKKNNALTEDVQSELFAFGLEVKGPQVWPCAHMILQLTGNEVPPGMELDLSELVEK